MRWQYWLILLQFVTVSLGTPQLILFSSLLSRENASLERRFGALNAIASNINGFDIKGKLNEIYDKYKGPLWGKVNDPNNYGQIISEISSTQPGSNKIGTYTVPGSGITHVTSDAASPSISSSISDSTAQSKGSLPIGGKAGDLASSSSRAIRATSSPSEKSSRGRNGKKTRSRRHRSRHHSHHRHHHHHPHHHHSSPYSSHSVRRPHSPYSGYSSPYGSGYDPYYPSASNSGYSRHQPHLPPPPPHPSIISSPYYPQAHSTTQYTSVPPAILGAQIGAALSQSQSPSAQSSQSPGPVKDATNVPSQLISPLSPIVPGGPGQPPFPPYSNVAALSGLPAMNNQLLNALLLNQLALASATTTPAPTTTKKPKGKKTSKKDASGKTVALTTSINTEDGTISIGGIDPEHVIKLVGGVVQSTGLNKALGSALNTVMSTVSKVGSQVVKQAVHSISDSVTFSLGQNGQVGPSISSRAQTKRRKSPTNSALKVGQALFQLRNQEPVADESEITDEVTDELPSESVQEESEPIDEKDEIETEETRVRRDKETPVEEEEEKLVKRSQRKRRVNKIRINRIKPGQTKDDSNVRTLTLGGTNISLRNTGKGGFSISIGEPNVPGDRRRDQGFLKEPLNSSNLSSTLPPPSS